MISSRQSVLFATTALMAVALTMGAAKARPYSSAGAVTVDFTQVADSAVGYAPAMPFPVAAMPVSMPDQPEEAPLGAGYADRVPRNSSLQRFRRGGTVLTRDDLQRRQRQIRNYAALETQSAAPVEAVRAENVPPAPVMKTAGPVKLTPPAPTGAVEAHTRMAPAGNKPIPQGTLAAAPKKPAGTMAEPTRIARLEPPMPEAKPGTRDDVLKAQLNTVMSHADEAAAPPPQTRIAIPASASAAEMMAPKVTTRIVKFPTIEQPARREDSPVVSDDEAEAKVIKSKLPAMPVPAIPAPDIEKAADRPRTSQAETRTTEASVSTDDAIPPNAVKKQLVFEADAVDVEDGQAESLDNLAENIVRNPEARLQVKAYASGDNDPGMARRVSLKRALSVRDYLVEKGVPGNKINVRALGNRPDNAGPPDRVDIIGM